MVNLGGYKSDIEGDDEKGHQLLRKIENLDSNSF